MTRVLYFDCFSGISGDMTLGALLDAGVPLDELTRRLGSLAIDGRASVGAAPGRCAAGMPGDEVRVHDQRTRHGAEPTAQLRPPASARTSSN